MSLYKIKTIIKKVLDYLLLPFEVYFLLGYLYLYFTFNTKDK